MFERKIQRSSKLLLKTNRQNFEVIILRNMTYLHKTKTRHFTTFTVYIFSNIPRKLGSLKALQILPVLLLFKPRSTAWSLSSVSLFCVCFHFWLLLCIFCFWLFVFLFFFFKNCNFCVRCTFRIFCFIFAEKKIK